MHQFIGVQRSKLPVRQVHLVVNLLLWSKRRSMSEASVTSWGWWESRLMSQCLCLGTTSLSCGTQQLRHRHWRRSPMPLRITSYEKVLHKMSGELHMWIRMKTWQTCWRSHWVVWSEPSLFEWFCIMFSQKKGMGIWEEIKLFLLPPRIGTTYPFAHTVWVFNFKLELWASIDFELELWASVDSVFYFFCFRRRWLGNPKWYPEWLYPILVWGECFSTVLPNTW